MPHLQPLPRDEIDPSLLPLLNRTEELLGFVPNDALTIARMPALFRSLLDMTLAVYAPGRVPPQTKRLVGLAASLEAGCGYCQAHTLFSAQKLEVPETVLRQVANGVYDDLDRPLRLALGFASKAAANPAAVDDGFMEDLRICYDDQQIAELLAVISLFGFLNRWNAGNRTDVEAEPQACAVAIRSQSD